MRAKSAAAGITSKPRRKAAVGPCCDHLEQAREIREAVAYNRRVSAIVEAIAEELERDHAERCLHGGQPSD
jgi:hypothetical protein